MIIIDDASLMAIIIGGVAAAIAIKYLNLEKNGRNK
jgi:hypothetical protein